MGLTPYNELTEEQRTRLAAFAEEMLHPDFWQKECSELQIECAGLRAERDEAVRQRDEWRQEHAEVYEERAGLRKERDEARAGCERWQQMHKDDTEDNLELIRVLRAERDEAHRRVTGLECERNDLLERYNWEHDTRLRLLRERDECNKDRKVLTDQLKDTHRELLQARRVTARLWRQCKAADEIVRELFWMHGAKVHLPAGREWKMQTLVDEYKAVRLPPREEK